jgi:hypothetical protein
MSGSCTGPPRLPAPKKSFPELLLSPWSGVFSPSVQSLCESCNLAASLIPRVRHRSDKGLEIDASVANARPPWVGKDSLQTMSALVRITILAGYVREKLGRIDLASIRRSDTL